ncbi:MAG: hypothetical protein JNG83_04175 [Opitutaceae bacterium]|nr:hypothetical protein [Opitutaceae bacterium]
MQLHPPPRSEALPPRRRRPDSGFTILEVAMASFVMAFGIASSILAMQSGFRSIDVARGTTLASQIMQSEIERLRLKSWAEIVALPEKAAVDVTTMFSANPAIASQFSVVRTSVEDGSRPGEVRFITLYVTWRSADGLSHTRSFRTMYAKNGLYDYYYTLAH